ncbi:imidazoleglycerol-phosphate dehydratase HisB [Clostridium botulinum]|uniref:Imidazoleglycerol-phosphate dehydratase n=1 Tax=Clostridium botulinum (strain Langeland / NCTC 10281 / Type F) TaxID=441772 RepID=HIS7_CLOBL|nr:imidazoleglycerol-phosphate dehydratase HisB [Clostridium botulinum]A7GDQ3.1 RecName: Full=Imidazoleglycerol-phosphate dehydratase; Short=IGPD [Clostridium botulinum F str. Langeland]ABS39862.1 imidazoleglycerol-phosphate dehydratase [Clostridium botulinum F str. Langeland]ADF99351.1 imidazoleglycerol-phosphate dehydratase [Clostridium botulinum F str. 230613]KKM43080.1 imidazoleglycerol-phosphate dehydratase [Clostridium botulinum]MBD5643035.1 imidazoleglycerol-phosphate dehydratase HisB [
MKESIAKVYRKTGETEIKSEINLYGEGKYDIKTGIGFFDHMLNLMARHGLIDVKLEAKGDLQVDSHHTVEDVGIVLGESFKKALGDKKGIKRYGTSFVPMDEALASVSIDISGRPYIVCDFNFTVDKLGEMDTELVEEFLRALAFNAGITLHARVLYGKNNHHMIEAVFKALGRALREAVDIDERINGVMSTKGTL